MNKENKKMGRPTNNPKEHRLGVRVDEETYLKLNKISEKLDRNKSSLIIEGINWVIKKNE